MQLYVLPLGGCCCNYEVIAPGVADGKRIHIPVPSFLIRLDDGSLALIDTGMSRLHVADPDLTWRGTPLADLLVPDMRRGGQLAVAPGRAGHRARRHQLRHQHASAFRSRWQQ